MILQISAISLRISTYENSSEAAEFDTIDNDGLKTEKSESIKNTEQIFTSASTIFIQRDDRRKKRSRSRSPRYPSSYSRHEKTRREFEIEVEALQEENKELRGQIEQYRVQITNVSLGQVQAEQRAAHWEHETNRLNVSYQECTKVYLICLYL
uniref:BZIP domain-containing protein n=1 Tax=Panagrolaimus davidi TaxID=227884 RepID=A0A914P902_9BILA